MKVKEKILLSVSVSMFIGAALYLGFYDQLTKSQMNKGKKVGLIYQKTNSIKRKPAQSLVWDDISLRDSIYSGDKIFTPQDSTAILNIGQKTSVTMSPQTLLNFEDVEDGHLRIALEEGGVSASINQNDKISSVGLGDEVLELTSIESSFMIDTTKEKSAITILGGSASLKIADQNVNLTQNEILLFNPLNKTYKKEKINFNSIYPTEGAFLDSTNTELIKFSWKSLVVHDSPIIIEVARDHQFSTIVASEETNNDFFDVNLPPNSAGKFYWRLKYKDSNASYAPIYHFEMISLLPLTIFNPKANEILFLSPFATTISVDFDWDEKNNSSFKLEYGNYENGIEKSLKMVEIVESKYLSEPLEVGKYWWRIQQKLKGGFEAWQEKEFFEIADSKTILPPNYISADENAIFKVQDNLIGFKWTGTPKANYIISIATEPSFEKIIEQHTVINGKYDWKINATGKLFWRIGHESLTDPSPIRSFKVKVEAPILNFPADEYQTTLLNQGDKLKFQWSNAYPENINHDFKIYEIVIFQGTKQIFRSTLKENEFSWSPKEAGDFEWKIEVPGSESPSQRFRVRFAPRP